HSGHQDQAGSSGRARRRKRLMAHVWICQCLCPQRHAILASTGEMEDAEQARRKIEVPLRHAIAELLEQQTLNPWCGLCNARVDTWFYETRRTKFRTMAEAAPMLAATEAEMGITRAVFGDMPGKPH